MRFGPGLALAEWLGVVVVDGPPAPGSAAWVESPLPLPQAASEPRARGTTAATAARRRVRLRMGSSPVGLHVVWPRSSERHPAPGLPERLGQGNRAVATANP